MVYTIVLMLLVGEYASAQHVLYSPYIDDPFEVIGKSDNYYWIIRHETRKYGKHSPPADLQHFEIYNSRMVMVNSSDPLVIPDNIVKQYFISATDYLDQLVIYASKGHDLLYLNRYAPDGRLIAGKHMVLDLPFNEEGNSFIMARCEDKSKILILCFEGAPGEGIKLDAYLFDTNWKLLSKNVYKHPYITQPLIQDDLISFPIEYYTNNSVKLANTGEWLMATPSRTNNNFLLFHFKGLDSAFIYREIQLPGASSWEDVALSVNNEKDEAFAGIVSVFRYQTLKNVQVVHYSLTNHQLDFDSSYRFNTLMAYRIMNENLIHESFIMVPGTGFMLLKEYGRPFESDFFDNNQYINPGGLQSVFAQNSISNNESALFMNRDGYTRYSRLSGPRAVYNRGDLSLFYFPANAKDSCWSGIMDKEQTTEFNLPYLSYLVIPAKKRIFLLYNSLFRNDDQFSNSTVLDYKGNLLTDEGLIYWKLTNTLNFQQSRQITDDEVAIPYDNYRRKGFAIVRF
ncbi:MAG: hypothetical protein C5B59_18095 [Bacteroidetes bacterium]|nr:MAG: hypothetical protein C5B59_18095 [Bacteroidota bacterium]